MMQLARGESPSPAKDYEENSPGQRGPKKPMLEWMPELQGPIAKIKDIKAPTMSNYASTARTKEIDKSMNKT